MNTPFLVVLLALCAHSAFAAGIISVDDQARFLAGMEIKESPLTSKAEQSNAWRAHASSMTEAWASLKSQQLAPIAKWAPSHLSQGTGDDCPLFYFFSGPDFVYAKAFHPNAPLYVMCGMEPVGELPDASGLSESALTASLGGLRKSMESLLSFSFFRTNDMATDLRSTALQGTLPVLYVMLARSGCRITDVQKVGLDDSGAFVPSGAKTSGVRITFTNAEGRRQSLIYFTTDLSNGGINNYPGFFRFCQTLGTGHSLLKAASYLMHNDEFSIVRHFLISHSRTLVQDDSGIPLKQLSSQHWLVFGHGNYVGPISLFKGRYQDDVQALFKDRPFTDSLPFSFGYRHHRNESSLMYGIALGYQPKTPVLVSGALPDE